MSLGDSNLNLNQSATSENIEVTQEHSYTTLENSDAQQQNHNNELLKPSKTTFENLNDNWDKFENRDFSNEDTIEFHSVVLSKLIDSGFLHIDGRDVIETNIFEKFEQHVEVFKLLTDKKYVKYEKDEKALFIYDIANRQWYPQQISKHVPGNNEYNILDPINKEIKSKIGLDLSEIETKFGGLGSYLKIMNDISQKNLSEVEIQRANILLSRIKQTYESTSNYCDKIVNEGLVSLYIDNKIELLDRLVDYFKFSSYSPTYNGNYMREMLESSLSGLNKTLNTSNQYAVVKFISNRVRKIIPALGKYLKSSTSQRAYGKNWEDRTLQKEKAEHAYIQSLVTYEIDNSEEVLRDVSNKQFYNAALYMASQINLYLEVSGNAYSKYFPVNTSDNILEQMKDSLNSGIDKVQGIYPEIITMNVKLPDNIYVPIKLLKSEVGALNLNQLTKLIYDKIEVANQRKDLHIKSQPFQNSFLNVDLSAKKPDSNSSLEYYNQGEQSQHKLDKSEAYVLERMLTTEDIRNGKYNWITNGIIISETGVITKINDHSHIDGKTATYLERIRDSFIRSNTNARSTSENVLLPEGVYISSESKEQNKKTIVLVGRNVGKSQIAIDNSDNKQVNSEGKTKVFQKISEHLNIYFKKEQTNKYFSDRKITDNTLNSATLLLSLSNFNNVAVIADQSHQKGGRIEVMPFFNEKIKGLVREYHSIADDLDKQMETFFKLCEEVQRLNTYAKGPFPSTPLLSMLNAFSGIPLVGSKLRDFSEKLLASTNSEFNVYTNQEVTCSAIEAYDSNRNFGINTTAFGGSGLAFAYGDTSDRLQLIIDVDYKKMSQLGYNEADVLDIIFRIENQLAQMEKNLQIFIKKQQAA